jgi:hypothetical protein
MKRTLGLAAFCAALLLMLPVVSALAELPASAVPTERAATADVADAVTPEAVVGPPVEGQPYTPAVASPEGDRLNLQRPFPNPTCPFLGDCSQYDSNYCDYRCDAINICCVPTVLIPGSYCPWICI